MVKKTQTDLLESLLNTGSTELNDLLTLDREVIGFQGLRDVDSMDVMDYLGEEPSTYPDLEEYCQDEDNDLEVQDALGTLEALADLVKDQEITFDPAETTFEVSCFTEPEVEAPCAIQEIVIPAADSVSGEKEDGVVPVSPLVKEEIKNKIKLRRLCEGKEEIKVEFPEPEPERLTEEEEEKRRIRREKNKLAAQKCRSRKRKLADILQQETDELVEKQDSLREEIKKLRDERDHLRDLIKVHSFVCPQMALSCGK